MARCVLLLVLNDQLVERVARDSEALSGFLRERSRSDTGHEPVGWFPMVVQLGLQELQSLVAAVALEPTRKLEEMGADERQRTDFGEERDDELEDSFTFGRIRPAAKLVQKDDAAYGEPLEEAPNAQ